MKRIYFTAIIFSFAMAVANAQEACDLLRVSSEAAWLPVSYVDKETNKPAGIANDFVMFIGSRLNIPIEIRTDLPWARTLKYLEQGKKIDMVAAIYWNKEREEKYLFTESYFMNEARVFVKKGKEFPFQRFQDLIGRVGGCSYGTSFGEEFDAFVVKYDLKIEGVKTKDQRFNKLLLERNDYIIQDYMDGMLYLKEAGLQDRIVVLPHPISVTKVYFALSRKSPCAALYSQINAVIDKAKKDGTLQGIIDKYIR